MAARAPASPTPAESAVAQTAAVAAAEVPPPIDRRTAFPGNFPITPKKAGTARKRVENALPMPTPTPTPAGRDRPSYAASFAWPLLGPHRSSQKYLDTLQTKSRCLEPIKTHNNKYIDYSRLRKLKFLRLNIHGKLFSSLPFRWCHFVPRGWFRDGIFIPYKTMLHMIR